jgi:hypothetical protein
MGEVLTQRADVISRVRNVFSRMTDPKMAGSDVTRYTRQFNKLVDDLLSPIGGARPEVLAGTGGIRTAARREVLEQLTGLDISGFYTAADPKLRGRLLMSNQMVDARKEMISELGGEIYRQGLYLLASDDKELAVGASKTLAQSSRVRRMLARAARRPGERPAIQKELSRYMIEEMKLPRAAELAKELIESPALMDDVREMADRSLDRTGIGFGEGELRAPRGRGVQKEKSLRSAEQYQGAFNPIGFGETESALSLINKSLKQTAAMIDKLHSDMKVRKKKAG